uniref:Uncharacterized protein n=1 Tax=Timspurckia oligopyrenoides TaxID=708627 RepID=A0A7S0ZE24_9RHOD|mmetsp:Transcript_1613/g.2876  ORF Transcript_1613/g.2876 Transcript_1613/m.2876 type:complete len:393 (+) Transcript_1613:66-1244(+)
MGLIELERAALEPDVIFAAAHVVPSRLAKIPDGSDRFVYASRGSFSISSMSRTLDNLPLAAENEIVMTAKGLIPRSIDSVRSTPFPEVPEMRGRVMSIASSMLGARLAVVNDRGVIMLATCNLDGNTTAGRTPLFRSISTFSAAPPICDSGGWCAVSLHSFDPHVAAVGLKPAKCVRWFEQDVCVREIHPIGSISGELSCGSRIDHPNELLLTEGSAWSRWDIRASERGGLIARRAPNGGFGSRHDSSLLTIDVCGDALAVGGEPRTASLYDLRMDKHVREHWNGCVQGEIRWLRLVHNGNAVLVSSSHNEVALGAWNEEFASELRKKYELKSEVSDEYMTSGARIVRGEQRVLMFRTDEPLLGISFEKATRNFEYDFIGVTFASAMYRFSL